MSGKIKLPYNLLMKNKYYSFLVLMLVAFFASQVNAQQLGQGQIMNPTPPDYYQTWLTQVTLTWNHKHIIQKGNDLEVKVTFGGREFLIEGEIYYNPEADWLSTRGFEDMDYGNELIIDFSEEAYREGYPTGVYTIEIPEGIVVDPEGDTNASQIVTFEKMNKMEPSSVTPPDGIYPLDRLNDVVISFNEPIVKVNPQASPVTVRLKNDWLGETIEIGREYIQVDDNEVSLYLGMLENGKTYNVEIPEGYLIIGEEYVNARIWLEYMIWDGMDPAIVISAPDSQSSPDVKPFILTWDYQTITMSPEKPETEFVCGFPDYGWQEGWRKFIPADKYKLIHVSENGDINYSPDSENPANAIYLDVRDYTAGYPDYQFEVFIPEGLVVNEENVPNPPFSYTFFVRNVWTDYEISAKDGVITVTWPGVEWVTFNMDNEENAVLYGAEDTVYDLEFTYGGSMPGQVTLYNENDHYMTIDLKDMELKEGSYKLYIPMGYVFVDDGSGDNLLIAPIEYSFKWENGTFAGIRDLMQESDCNLYKVYSLQGMKLLETKDIERLSSLPSGIYIVNGKKFVIQK